MTVAGWAPLRTKSWPSRRRCSAALSSLALPEDPKGDHGAGDARLAMARLPRGAARARPAPFFFGRSCRAGAAGVSRRASSRSVCRRWICRARSVELRAQRGLCLSRLAPHRGNLCVQSLQRGLSAARGLNWRWRIAQRLQLVRISSSCARRASVSGSGAGGGAGSGSGSAGLRGSSAPNPEPAILKLGRRGGLQGLGVRSART